jgi:hypothetical protein
MQVLGFREFNSSGRPTGRVAFATEGTRFPSAKDSLWVRDDAARADNDLTADVCKSGYILGCVVTHG